ncbi:MAG: ABC transporter permease [Actinomycetota bacterium]|jgi:ABC-2 type transport system permease protein/oleandomycin transport system permease protein|nr:ABC transporter permease [Actinomycetota bacterium]MDA8341176.1 ABC transporter permease [Actinomycetota bacterium]
MTALDLPAASPPASATPSPRSIGVGVALVDIAGITKRNLIRILRTPRLLIFSSIQPVMFVLLFRYVFAGAIRVPHGAYVDYLMPGIFVQTSLFGGSSTAVGLATDLQGGIIDRFRSLPMARSAVLAGRTIADLIRNVFVLALMVIVGVLVGFRFHGSIGTDLGGLGLVLLFGYAFSWVYATVGLLVKDPETAQVAAFLPLFPLVFASSAFVPVSSMPGWLQAFANVQPVSVTVDAVRGLLAGGSVEHWLWQSLAWAAGILVVFSVLAVRQYRKV